MPLEVGAFVFELAFELGERGYFQVGGFLEVGGVSLEIILLLSYLQFLLFRVFLMHSHAFPVALLLTAPSLLQQPLGLLHSLLLSLDFDELLLEPSDASLQAFVFLLLLEGSLLLLLYLGALHGEEGFLFLYGLGLGVQVGLELPHLGLEELQLLSQVGLGCFMLANVFFQRLFMFFEFFHLYLQCLALSMDLFHFNAFFLQTGSEAIDLLDIVFHVVQQLPLFHLQAGSPLFVLGVGQLELFQFPHQGLVLADLGGELVLQVGLVHLDLGLLLLHYLHLVFYVLVFSLVSVKFPLELSYDGVGGHWVLAIAQVLMSQVVLQAQRLHLLVYRIPQYLYIVALLFIGKSLLPESLLQFLLVSEHVLQLLFELVLLGTGGHGEGHRLPPVGRQHRQGVGRR